MIADDGMTMTLALDEPCIDSGNDYEWNGGPFGPKIWTMMVVCQW